MTPKPRVRFSQPDPLQHADAINVRDVLLDGVHVGWLYGINPSPGNPQRPTAFRFVTSQGRDFGQTYDRLTSAREMIERELTR